MRTFGVKLRVKEIKLPVWVSRGKMLVNRYSLAPNDLDHPYNWVRRVFFGLVDPEDFGISEPHYFDENAPLREWY